VVPNGDDESRVLQPVADHLAVEREGLGAGRIRVAHVGDRSERGGGEAEREDEDEETSGSAAHGGSFREQFVP
jgi:hypothetical protein